MRCPHLWLCTQKRHAAFALKARDGVYQQANALFRPETGQKFLKILRRQRKQQYQEEEMSRKDWLWNTNFCFT